MRVGFVQISPVLGDVHQTIEKLEKELINLNADLLVLPELCNSGYNFKSFQRAFELAEEIDKSIFIRFLTRICQEKGFYIVSGFNEKDGDALYNTAVLVGPEGFIGKYRKMHLFWNEKDIFKPGNTGLPVFNIHSCKIGILICFDWFFPEIWRIMALKGADIVCHPSNLMLPGLAQKAIPVYAMLNRYYVILANRCGKEEELEFTGSSLIANPTGEILAQASPFEEQSLIIEADIHLSRNKMITPRNHLIEDRRPEEYKLLSRRLKNFKTGK